MNAYYLKYFTDSVMNGRELSWQLRQELREYNQPMPPELCQKLGLRDNSSYGEGVKKYAVITSTNKITRCFVARAIDKKGKANS
jgi:hypothetical protein